MGGGGAVRGADPPSKETVPAGSKGSFGGREEAGGSGWVVLGAGEEGKWQPASRVMSAAAAAAAGSPPPPPLDLSGVVGDPASWGLHCCRAGLMSMLRNQLAAGATALHSSYSQHGRWCHSTTQQLQPTWPTKSLSLAAAEGSGDKAPTPSLPLLQLLPRQVVGCPTPAAAEGCWAKAPTPSLPLLQLLPRQVKGCPTLAAAEGCWAKAPTPSLQLLPRWPTAHLSLPAAEGRRS